MCNHFVTALFAWVYLSFFFCVIIGLKALFLVIIAGKGNRDEADGAEGGWESSGSFTGEGSSGEGFSKE